MGRLDSGLAMSLMFLIPGLWCIGVVVMSVFDFTLSEAMCYVIVGMALILNSEIAVPPLLIPVTLLLFWLFLLSYSLGWILKHGCVEPRPRIKRRTGSRKQ